MEEKNTNNVENCRRVCVAIDVEALTYSSDTLISGNFDMSPKCCIFKTPNILSRHNKKAYAPNAFSIGPWHLGKPHLEATQKIKKKYLQGLIGRFSSFPDLRYLEDQIRKVANDARDCYAEPVEFTTEEFVKILVLDGCFIIELFRKNAEVSLRGEDDPIFTMACMLQFLHHDLVLLENQIPWIVLELLFNITKIPGESSLDLLAMEFFRGMIPPQYASKQMMKLFMQHTHKSKHILDLLRNWLTLSLKEEESGEGSHQTAASGEGSQPHLLSRENESYRLLCPTSLRLAGIKIKNLISKGILKPYKCNQPLVSEENKSKLFAVLPCATSLREAGIKFKKLPSEGILDINFENGVLEIPPLIVQESTETILRNLISFEQCDPKCPPRFTSYAKLMDHLIESAKDMEMLCEEGIIENWLTVEDASKFFNDLYIDTFVKKFYYRDDYKKVNEYRQHRWPRWRANLMHNYFNTPWAVVGIVVAGLLLVLTIIGTVCSIIQTT